MEWARSMAVSKPCRASFANHSRSLSMPTCSRRIDVDGRFVTNYEQNGKLVRFALFPSLTTCLYSLFVGAKLLEEGFSLGSCAL